MRIIFVFCYIIVSVLGLNPFVFGHDILPPTEIIPKAPRLEEHDQRENEDGEKLHFHAWCYDTIAGNGNQSGWWPEWYPAKYGQPPYTVEIDTPVIVEPPVESTPTPIVKPPVEPPSTLPVQIFTNVPIPETAETPAIVETPAPTPVAESQAPVVNTEAPVVAPIQNVPSVVSVLPSDIVLTQVMFHDWTSAGGGGLPQWFELHNRGGDGTVKGFQLTFFVAGGGKVIIVLKDCPLSSGETMIVARKRVGTRLGHPWGHSQGVAKVYIDENILNLKHKWMLTDSAGKEIYRRDAHWDHGWGHHERGPFGKGAYRKAVEVIPSEPYTGPDPIYYGNAWDAGNPPGYHVDVAPKAPHLVRPKRVMLWGALKKSEK